MNYRRLNMISTTSLMSLGSSPRLICGVEGEGNDGGAGGGSDTGGGVAGQDQTGDQSAGDTQPGGEGQDSVAGGEGQDTVAGGQSSDTVAAGAADDKVGAPESYEAFTVPEGMELDTQAIEMATPIFKDLGLTQDQAQKIVDVYAGQLVPHVAQHVVAQLLTDFGMQDFGKWADQIRELPALGGQPGKPISPEALTEAQTHIARFRDQFGGPELTEFLETSGIGNHPAVVTAFYNAGKALADDSFVRGDAGAQGDQSLARSMYGPEFAPRS